MNKTYLLWAFGPDHAGIVAHVTKILFLHRCNLEDSSMMRLGAEFGIFLIFTTRADINKQFQNDINKLQSKMTLQIGIKPISSRLAAFKPMTNNSYLISLHGKDRPGLVFKLTELLSKYRFNISDLQTHRTHSKKQSGYVLFIEGDMPSTKLMAPLKRGLAYGLQRH